MWKSLVKHETIDGIMKDKGLAKLGDSLANLCYSLAKSSVLGSPTGEKVRDRVLAQAIRSTSVYQYIGHRTDAGTAGDAYEAIIAYLWLTEKTTIDDMVSLLCDSLKIDSQTGRKEENAIAAEAFRLLLEHYIDILPPSSNSR
jgi:hypothetical protein